MEAKGILDNINGQEATRIDETTVFEIDAEEEDIDDFEEPVDEVPQTVRQNDRAYTLYEDF
jgi:hypothetical protein